jgi:hypothetical protein
MPKTNHGLREICEQSDFRSIREGLSVQYLTAEFLARKKTLNSDAAIRIECPLTNWEAG